MRNSKTLTPGYQKGKRLILAILLLTQYVDAQDTTYLSLIKGIVSTEASEKHLIHRLDSLKSTITPTRSQFGDYFNRSIDFGFTHRRIQLQLNFKEYQINLLCRNDTVVLSTITAGYPTPFSPGRTDKIVFENYDASELKAFLTKRNNLYRSAKKPKQAIREITSPEIYAFNCGITNEKTKKGKLIDQLVKNENSAALIDMLKSLNCEEQAYGVTGLTMLATRGYTIQPEIRTLLEHIRKRNSPLESCSGCIIGVRKIYSE